MIKRYPALFYFNRLYWHQNGPELYGSADEAFRQYLLDASKLPDGGASLKREIYKELMIIGATDEYKNWALANQLNEDVIRQVRGNILLPETIERLRKILESTWRPRDA
jgi:hypothetical protein